MSRLALPLQDALQVQLPVQPEDGEKPLPQPGLGEDDAVERTAIVASVVTPSAKRTVPALTRELLR